MQRPLPQTTLANPESISRIPCLQPSAKTESRSPHALYIHIPFCFHKCHYCDFYSIVDDSPAGDRQEVFTDRLITELRLRAGQMSLRPLTIFIGGGTPTLLRPALWTRLLACLADLGIPDNVREWTVEANPETVTPELMGLLAAGGVNRVSLGAQSFQPELLKTLERWHDPANVARAAAMVRDAGIRNYNLDLIFAIPGQTLETLKADIDAALALEPTHISCYGLTYEPNTAMTKRLELGQFKPMPEETERAMYELVLDKLAAAGFEQYEVSNFGRRAAWRGETPATLTHDESGDTLGGELGAGPAYRCRHNLVYWTNGNWLGVGPSAASHVDGYRWKNQAHLGKYLDSKAEPPIVDLEHLPAERRTGELLMLRLRLRRGAPEAWLRANLGSEDPRWKTIDYLREIGMLEWGEGHLRLTRKGLFVADAVIRELL
ncbi:MAG: radical SAM family heme chaperone HemW [Planctomycetota bacterium]|nr:radical SAM family heme chaperone HemW [Planctomycetota bacterium]